MSLFGRLNKEGKDIASSPVSAGQLGAMLDLITDGTISGKIAKDLFEIIWREGGDPRVIVEQRGMKQVTDFGRHREGGRRDHRAKPGQGRRRQVQSESDRLVRRSSDEVLGRQGEPASRQRSPEKETWPLTRARCTTWRIGLQNLIRGQSRANISTRAVPSRPCILRSGDKFGALQDRITANHPALIRSFLIDFDCP